MYCDPVRCRGTAHRRSVSTESWPSCWWQWSWFVGRSSYQGRSWRRVCSSRSVTWSLVSQIQSPLQERWTHYNRSSTPSYDDGVLGKNVTNIIHCFLSREEVTPRKIGWAWMARFANLGPKFTIFLPTDNLTWPFNQFLVSDLINK